MAKNLKRKSFDFSSFDWDANKEEEKPVSLILIIIGKIINLSIIAGLVLLMRYNMVGDWFFPFVIIITVVFLPFILFDWKSHPLEPFKSLGHQSLLALISLVFISPFFIGGFVGNWLGYDWKTSSMLIGFGLLGIFGICVELFKWKRK